MWISVGRKTGVHRLRLVTLLQFKRYIVAILLDHTNSTRLTRRLCVSVQYAELNGFARPMRRIVYFV